MLLTNWLHGFSKFSFTRKGGKSRKRRLTTDRRLRSAMATTESLEVRVMPAVIMVTTTADVVDAGDEVTSLREAMLQANSNGEDDEIHLAPGTYSLTMVEDGDYDGETGALTLSEYNYDLAQYTAVSIVGAGAGSTIINGAALGGPALYGSAGSMTLQDLTVTGVNDEGPHGGYGAVLSHGTLNVINSEFSNNSGVSTGGIYGYTVNVTGSTFTNNSGQTGAIFAGIALNVRGSTFVGNTALGNGGAIYATFGTIGESTFSGNTAYEGGAIYAYGGDLQIVNSTISGNSATSNGGAISSNSTSLTLINSTVSGNTAGNAAGGIYHYAVNVMSPSSILNSTIVGNTATGYGGLYLGWEGITLSHTIIAGNISTNDGPSDIVDESIYSSFTATGSYNIIGNAASASGIVNGVDGNIVGVNWTTVLNPTLADNGGPTMTHALLPGSVALNAGDPNFDDTNYPLDQRGTGYNRVVYTAIDIGAFEEQSLPPVITSANAASAPENQTGAIDVDGYDTLGNSVSYSISGGGDAARFSIHPTTGVLTFLAAPNFEAPTDADQNNTYVVQVRVSNAFYDTDQTVTITVTDVNEAPTNVTLSPASVAENSALNTVIGAFSSTDQDAANTFTYTLVSGDGDDDNDDFIIVGDQLQVNTALDFETKSSYSIFVRTTDQGGLFFEKQLTITVVDVNETPTDIALSNATVAENSVTGTVVGELSSSDPDAANTFTYTLVSGDGDAGNATFMIVGGQLQVNGSLDFENQDTYSVRVRTTDQNNLFFEKNFVITVTDVNETPTDLALSPATVAENSALNTAIGTLTSTDQDSGNTFTYTLVNGDGAENNGSFLIVGDQLQVNTALNFETQDTYSVRVRTADQNGLFFDKQLTITVSDVNETPTDLSLSPSTIVENSVGGSLVGLLTSTDPDASQTFTYTLVAGDGSGDNADFQIIDDQLILSISPDYETKSSYSIRVRTTDQGNLFTEKELTVAIQNVNEFGPTDIALSSSSIAENSAANSVVGAFTAIDEDGAGSFTYTLVAGDGSSDNAAFTIVGDQLQINASPNFELKDSYSIRVRTTDAGNLFYEKEFLISITDVNEAPTVLNLSDSSILEGSPANSVVGTLSSVDPDSGNTFTYTLVAGDGSTNNGTFTIVDDELRILISPNYSVKDSYTIRVRTTDQGGQSLEQAFVISIEDLNGAPTDLSLSSNMVAENSDYGTVIGTFSTVDPDAGNTFTYALVTGEGSTDNSAFEIDENGQLLVNASFDYETKSTYSLRVRTTDQGNLSTEKVFTVTVSDVNETPTDVTLSNATLAENSAAGSVIGTFSSTDPDADNTFTYALVAGTGGGDNSAFTITGSQLLINASPNFEMQGSYSIRVQTTDQNGLSFVKTFSITITDVNEAPIDLALAPLTVAENSAIYTSVGTFSSFDPDTGNAFTYTLVSGEGSTDNGAFVIEDGQLKVNSALDYEAQSAYSVRVRTTDQGGLFFEKSLTITVTDVNEAPTDLTLGGNTIAENSALNSLVSTFSGADPDQVGSLSYSLVSGDGDADNAAFSIAGNQLLINASPDFEAQSSYSIRVRTTDQGGLSFEKTFTVTVTDVNEAPSVLDDLFTIDENLANGSVVDSVIGSDPDAGDSVTYSIVAGNTDGAFAINAATGEVTVANALALNFEVNPAFTLTIRVTDSEGLTGEDDITITLSDVNEAPTLVSTPSTTAFISKTAKKSGAPLIVPNVLVTDPDIGQDFQVGGGTLTISLNIQGSLHKKKGFLPYDTVGGLGGASAIGTLSGPTQVGDRMQYQVVLNAGTTAEQVQTFLRGLTFSTKGKGLKVATRSFQLQLTDVAGAMSAMVQQTINVSKK